MPQAFKIASKEEIYNAYGSADVEEIRRVDGEPLTQNVPSHATVPVFLGAACEKIPLDEARIKPCDFGEAFQPAETARLESHAPLHLRSPEQLLTPTEPSSPFGRMVTRVYHILRPWAADSI